MSEENKPVVWLLAHTGCPVLDTAIMPAMKVGATPLYTHPSRSLTDEEILSITDKVYSELDEAVGFALPFARAIEKRLKD